MEPEFWLTRWQNHEIGFHQPDGQPLLHQYWARLALPAGSRVCVPLCGKTRDLAWLAEQGHHVTGIELSEQAAREFFTESKQDYHIDTRAGLRRYHTDTIEILVGDLFALPATFFADFEACYDRAAMIALPANMRRRYIAHLYGNLAVGAQALLICLSYRSDTMDGPPFSITAEELHHSLASCAHVQKLLHQTLAADAPLAQRGARELANTLYQIQIRTNRSADPAR